MLYVPTAFEPVPKAVSWGLIIYRATSRRVLQSLCAKARTDGGWKRAEVACRGRGDRDALRHERGHDEDQHESSYHLCSHEAVEKSE